MAEMYNWDKSLSKEKSRRNTQNPSFSSSLLDEIYRSLDGSVENYNKFDLQKQKVEKTQNASGGGRRLKSNSMAEAEEIASFRRACLVDKWMETKCNEKVSSGRHRPPPLPEFDWKLALDNDPMFFSSGSNSSDSSFGWYSEAEEAKPKQKPKPKPSCFGPLNQPKQVKTSVSTQKNQSFEDQTDKTDDNSLIRSKTRALKIYTSLKKVKQPISPGGRLTSFLNTLFTNGHTKKTKDSGFEDRTQSRPERKSKSTNVSTCSSASSFSRSCLSKNSQKSRDQLSNGSKRTVRFFPEEKNGCKEQDFEKLTSKFPWPRPENSKFKEIPTGYDDKKYDFYEDDDDMASDSSSDLFELDHLTIFKNKQYCEELPVYETTNLGTNRAIASGLIY